MERVVQAAFEQPDNHAELINEPLVVHQRTPDSQNCSLIIFVHGLRGSRYGEAPTWGDFPRFVFEDFPQLDVGLYRYKTALEKDTIPLPDEAQVFSGILRDDLRQYKTIILVGHSMGGLLCKAVIAHLIDTARDTLKRIGGLFLLASPQLGSLRMPKFLSLFSSDAKALEPHGSFITAINDKFEDNLYLDEKIQAVDKTIIPTWGVRGTSDEWVDALSAGIGLSSMREKVIRGSHTDVVKPKSKTADPYPWVKERIEICLQRYEYDVFLASPMASLDTDDDYKRYREGALRIEQALADHCGFDSVFYAGRDIPTRDEFEAHDLSLGEDFRAIAASRYFMLVYPERTPSSVIFEAGIALAMGKPAVYLVDKKSDLPFLLQMAETAFKTVRVKIYENCPGTDEVVKLIEHNKAGILRPEP